MTTTEMLREFNSFETIRRIRVLNAQANYRCCLARGYDLSAAEAELRAAWAACPEHGTPRD